jgi:TPR repeat protein
MKKFSRGLALAVMLSAVFSAQAQDGDLAAAKEAIKKRDFAAAIKLLQPLVDKNDPKAMAAMGRMRLAGQGMIKDEGIALDLFKKGADAGDPESIYLLARQTHLGNGLPRDDQKAVALYKKSADLGYPDARFWYGLCLLRGIGGLPQDKAAAVPWVRSAAELGHSTAQAWLGDFYRDGDVLEKDLYQAVSWYRKSALQMDPNGQRSLGAAYARGNGVARDDAEALKWLLSAAYLRDVDALDWVASFYENARGGLVQDLVAADMWYTLALARDSRRTSSKTGAERVAAKLTPAQLAEAQNRAKQWPVAADFAKAIAATDAAKALGTAAAPALAGATTIKPAASGARSGSGFVIGVGPTYVVSNHHVVKDCKNIKIMPYDLPAVLRAKDERNDLALLSVANLQAPALKVRVGRSVRPGDDLVTLGYPLAGLLAAAASVNTGTVTNLGGLNNDTSQFQMSVPTQPGNSGGPVLDTYGQLVGVVVAQINAVAMGQAIGSIPQNVNFAINTATLSGFLEASNVDFATTHLHQDAKAKHLEAADVGSLARRSTVRVECSMQ